jgi:hypothetical protein
MTGRALKAFLLLGSLLLLTCCSQGLFKSLTEINQLQQQLVNQFHEKRINVNLYNSDSLTVTFINSPLNQGDRTERMKRAQETALFVTRNYPPARQLQSIAVSFAVQEKRYLIVNYFASIDWFPFDRNGALIPDVEPGEPEDLRRAVVRYSKQRNESEVELTRVQLDGDVDLGLGLALVPHFTVPGDAQAANHTPHLPKWVGLEFASYCKEKRYSSDSPLKIKADGKVIYTGTARLMSSSMNNGSASEFLSQRISYQQFREMARAGEVTIILGAKEYPLTSDQLAGLRDMAKYAE